MGSKETSKQGKEGELKLVGSKFEGQIFNV